MDKGRFITCTTKEGTRVHEPLQVLTQYDNVAYVLIKGHVLFKTVSSEEYHKLSWGSEDFGSGWDIAPITFKLTTTKGKVITGNLEWVQPIFGDETCITVSGWDYLGVRDFDEVGEFLVAHIRPNAVIDLGDGWIKLDSGDVRIDD